MFRLNKKKEREPQKEWMIVFLWWLVSTVNLIVNHDWWFGWISLLVGISWSVHLIKKEAGKFRGPEQEYAGWVVVSVFFGVIILICTVQLTVNRFTV